uniref:CRISPR-associated endoribonuclease n=1 Tax=Prevotella sp. GTC17254 TaxID=3236794 RepID=A0AB33J262_9BACT
MKFKIRLEVLRHRFGNVLPINYQYELSSAIYHILSEADIEYSTWLHENGFESQSDGKRFKLFCFSNLNVPNFRIQRDRLIIESQYVDWYLSFLPENSTQKFIEGVFRNQIFQIGDIYSTVEFAVRDIQILQAIAYEPEMSFSTLSPICVGYHESDTTTTYLSPQSSNYEEALLAGLVSRYEAFYGKPYTGERYCRLRLLSAPKSKLVVIKAHTPQQIKVRGYSYAFTLALPEPLMHIAYESGLGEKTSMGFGMIK